MAPNCTTPHLHKQVITHIHAYKHDLTHTSKQEGHAHKFSHLHAL